MRKFSQLAVVAAFSLYISSCSEDDPASGTNGFLAAITVTNPTVNEANGMTGFNVSLDQVNNTGSSVTVDYTVGGTATAGTDYQALSGSVSIADGMQELNVNVIITDDSEDEQDETIIVTLESNDEVTASSQNSATFTITDDDDPGTGGTCPNDNSVNTTNTACTDTPSVANSYTETVSGDVRTIVTNRVPNHTYGNQVPNFVTNGLTSTTETFDLDATPALASSSTSIVDSEFRPAYDMGIALNGVPIDPAPGEPFIFENSSTGEFNWDWVFEPNNNRTAVGLDCNTSHLQPNMMTGTGLIHYHGDMMDYAEDLDPNINSGNIPTQVLQIGWGADGFPILYKFGPDQAGTIKRMTSSYVLKTGERPGDGVSEPCGEYSGKYTNDYEFSQGAGDLDECNGIARTVILGNETFDYYYVITEEFPVIPRCISGTPGDDFKKGM